MKIEIETVKEVTEVINEGLAPATKAANFATNAFFKTVGKVRRFSPEILMVAGVAGVVTAAVLACKATLKLEDVVAKAELEAADVKDRHSVNEFDSETEYTKTLAKVYLHRSVDILKLYTPALSVGIVGISCLAGAHGIMSKRNVAMAAAVKAVESTFGDYRKRVAEELGEEKEREIRFDLKKAAEDELDEDGNPTGNKMVTSVESGYSRCFDEYNEMWSNVPGQNQMTLDNQQNWLNDRLNARGYLFLNDVYKALGFEETPAGQVTGWLRRDHKDSKDGFVDFGLMDIENQAKRDFVNAYERSAWLDFNVDGVIFDKI